mgnify:CR=1 FL=1
MGINTVSYSFCGTVPFMSPEVVSSRIFSVPTDVLVQQNGNVTLNAASVHKACPTSKDEEKARLPKISHFLSPANCVCNKYVE